MPADHQVDSVVESVDNVDDQVSHRDAVAAIDVERRGLAAFVHDHDDRADVLRAGARG